MKNILTLLFMAISSVAMSQVPNTNVYLFDYLPTSDGSAILAKPRMITADNINGYNNQPKWFNANELYITQQNSEDQLTDLVKYDLRNEKKSNFTKTSLAEYSPTLTPDGKNVTCIRVEADGNQVLWQYPLDRSHAGKRVLNHVKDIGYHHWISDTGLVLFIVDNPMKMILANTDDEDTYLITTKIGRCFGKMSNGEIVYVYKYTDSIWHLKAFIPSTGKSRFIAETIEGSEDFSILEDDSILMGGGSKIYRLASPYRSWIQLADLQTYDIEKITRLAYHQGKLAIVSH